MILTKQQIKEIKSRHTKGESIKDLSNSYGVSRSCIYKHIKGLREEKIDIESIVPINITKATTFIFKMDNHTIELRKDEVKAFFEALV